ncbi:hypothetical protein niasHT_039824 [Heterodera trifolii]|uniref:PHD-type domain-containing protein n=1 Tax=Heterodera trifolii TaxID=157864 RepID=A0ABD2ITA2_9BILA
MPPPLYLSPIIDLIRCQICAHSKCISKDAQLVPRDKLWAHIAAHINYRPNSEKNERLKQMCQREYEHCICIDFAERLGHLSGEDGHRHREQQQANIMTFPAAPPPHFASSSSNLHSLSSNSSSFLPPSSFADALPSLAPSSSSSKSVSSSSSISGATANNGPAEKAIGPSATKAIKLERVVPSGCLSVAEKVDVNPGIDNNEEEATHFYNNTQLLEMEEAENEADHRHQQTESAGESGTKETTERAPRKRATDECRTKTPQGNKRRSCSTGRTKPTLNATPSSVGGTTKKGATQRQVKGTDNGRTEKGTPSAEAAQPTQSRQKKDNTNDNKNCGLCKKALKSTSVRCSKCKGRFHGKCVKIRPQEAKRIPYWQCPKCQLEENGAEEEEDEDIQQMYCSCLMPDNKEKYIACDGCNEWFHPKCVKLTQESIDALGDAPFLCKKCLTRPRKWFDDKMARATKMEPAS